MNEINFTLEMLTIVRFMFKCKRIFGDIIFFPIDLPLLKSPAFGNVMALPKAGDFYNGGLWDNS